MSRNTLKFFLLGLVAAVLVTARFASPADLPDMSPYLEAHEAASRL